MKTDQGPVSGDRGPNCFECRYMAITWDVRMPYGCKLMGFRSKVVPSLEVLRTDGRFCGGFSPKPIAPKDVFCKTKSPLSKVESSTGAQKNTKTGIKILV